MKTIIKVFKNKIKKNLCSNYASANGRFIKLASLCISLCIILVGCSLNNNSKQEPNNMTTSPITIVWWHTMDSQYDELVNEIVDKYNSSQNEIVVMPEYMGSFNDINEALVAANAAGDGLPGLAVCNTKFIASYADNNLFEDLNPYIEETGFDISNIESGMYSVGNFHGKQIAMPFFHNTHVIYYNKDIANEYNLTIPSNFEEFDDFFKEIKNKANVTPLCMQSLDFYYGSLYRNAGVNIVKDSICDLNSDESIKITKKIKSWVDNGYISWLEGNDASSNMKKDFYQEKCFAILHNSTSLEIHKDNANFEVGIAWYPKINGNSYADLGGGVIGIPSKNSVEVKNASWKFLSYLCSNETTIKIALETGYLPICKDANNENSTIDYLDKYPQYKEVFDNLDKVIPPFINESASEICKIWQHYMNLIMLDNGDVEECLNEAVYEINEVLND